MTEWEILQTAKQAHKEGYKTVILQSGEDFTFTVDKIADIIKQIKDETDLFITLSLGERSYEDYKKLKDAGADRYLLKHETSDPILYRSIHPDLKYSNRIKCLKNLKEIGFETGSGIMVGIPGQTFESIANDILLFKELDIDMIGIGPYIPHPKTPLAKKFKQVGGYFTPATGFYNIEEMILKIYAITRIVTKTANIPATTALTTINKQKGRELALNCGANVVMLNITDEKYRKFYEIYPDKVNNIQKAQDIRRQTEEDLYKIGKKPL